MKKKINIGAVAKFEEKKKGLGGGRGRNERIMEERRGVGKVEEVIEEEIKEKKSKEKGTRN